MQKVEVLINVIKIEDTKLIECKAIISQNYASDFNGTCYPFSDQVVWLHGEAHMELQRHKQRIPYVSRGDSGRSGGQGHGFWMRGGRDGVKRGGKDGIGGRSGV